SLKDLLDLASVGRAEQNEAVDLNAVIKQVCADLEVVISTKNARIETDVLPVIHGVPLQMHQLFYNLINNALKFSADGRVPSIKLTWQETTYQEARYQEIVVSDNGIGFDQAYAEKIFQMFQRLHTRDAYSGTGIGLALCKKVVENHGGIIFAKSGKGVGAHFHILLPVAT
ncbi:MAG: hypothetical protein EOP49_04105, partial [Sphingobacteriales bacterium]